MATECSSYTKYSWMFETENTEGSAESCGDKIIPSGTNVLSPSCGWIPCWGWKRDKVREDSASLMKFIAQCGGEGTQTEKPLGIFGLGGF